MPPEQPPATRRAEAERNRATILAVARAAFAEPEADVSMAEIARRAGVGMATLYRNFPGRRELLETLFADEVDALCDGAERLADQAPGAALHTWLDRVFAFFGGKRRIGAELLEHSDAGNPFFGRARDRVLDAGRPLLTGAQRAGEIRADLTLEQILDMIGAVSAIRGEPGYVQPIYRTVLTGLRASPPAEPHIKRLFDGMPPA